MDTTHVTGPMMLSRRSARHSQSPASRLLDAGRHRLTLLALSAFGALALAPAALADEANLRLPDLSSQKFLGMPGTTLLWIGVLVCFGGLGFGAWIYGRLKSMPIHSAMREISELIYETCKTYMVTQGKFLAILWVLIGACMVYYFGVLSHNTPFHVCVIPARSCQRCKSPFQRSGERAAPASDALL